ncbi:glycoside hydrolase family protein [Escherichia coli]|nr:glycoside hydrolase family protein [Escherichia coli]
MNERLKTHSKTQKKSADLVSNKLRIGVFQRYQMKCKSVSKKSPRYMIRERGALDDIRAGRIERAISRCRNIWASLPGAGYGQREHSLEKLVTVWRTAGGVPA